MKKSQPSQAPLFRIALLVVAASLVFAGLEIWSLRLDRAALEKRLSLSKYDSDYLARLRDALQFPPKGANELTLRDAIVTAARLNVRLNQYDDVSDQISAPISRTFSRKIPVRMSADNAVVSLPSMRRYAYEIVNVGSSTVNGLLLYQDMKWSDVNSLVVSAGITKREAPLDRAVAIWDFLMDQIHTSFPPTEGREEHDVMKYLVCHGKGMCDDSAIAFTQLGKAAGLKTRFWGLDGHVVPEAFIDGKWRMFDANLGFYAHNPTDIRDVYGVEDLAKNPALFKSARFHPRSSLKNRKDPFGGISAYFTSTDNNRIYGDDAGISAHQFAYELRPHEKIVFRNHNIGKYWLARYPVKNSPYFNGHFSYDLNRRDLKISGSLNLSSEGDSLRISNATSQPASFELSFASPFPLVGGEIHTNMEVKKGKASLTLKDADNGIENQYEAWPRKYLNTDSFFSMVGPWPTYRYIVAVHFEPNTEAELSRFNVISDFQFSEIALLKLKAGSNSFNISSPTEPAASSLRATVSFD